jgi:restriction system protein
MSVWLVRAGRTGENEQIALEHGIVTIGWNELPDLSSISERHELTSLYQEIYPNAGAGRVSNQVGQIWAFKARIRTGDLAVLPLKTQSAIAIGRVSGDYEFRSDLGASVKHTRKVDWIRTDIPRTAFDQDLLYSFGAFMTVCQVKRNNAEGRIHAMLSGKHVPQPSIDDDANGDEMSSGVLDIEQAAQDQILEHIQRRFAGHDLAKLVDAVLTAEGYLTRVSPPGPDGGVDILAGSGPMGFDAPRLCVQVKSSASPADVNILRGLQGILQNFQAGQGLLVCWGGFKSSVLAEARQAFFTIRLWDSGDLLRAIVRNYDKFSDELQAELPLKRIWTLVLEE